MKDTAVVHLTKCAEKTIIASANIAKFIASELELPLVDGPGRTVSIPFRGQIRDQAK